MADPPMVLYELSGPDDDVWLCTKKLKDAGYDIEEWAKESETMNQDSVERS